MGFLNRIKGIFAESVRIDFLGGGTEEAEILEFDKNAKGKYALVIQFPQSLGEQKATGYVYDASDFLPNPEVTNWRTFYGIIICWKDSTGENDIRPLIFDQLNEKIKMLKKQLSMAGNINFEQIREMELKHTSQARKEEKFEDAESYTAIKELVATVDDENKKSKGNIFGGINE